MRKQIVSAMALCLTWLCLGLASCTDEALVEVTTEQGTGEPFMLTASSGDDSRLALGQDGLSVKWEPGDQLVLVDKSKKLAPIFLNSTLDAPAASANFVAETGVPAGDYWVIYNYNENLVYGHNQFMTIDNINDSDKLAMWGEIKVSAGDSSASIQMKHIYAKVKVTLKNTPSATYGDYRVGMYASKGGFPMYKQFTANGFENAEYGFNPNPNYQHQYTYFASKQKLHNVFLGNYQFTQWEDENGNMHGTTQAEMAECSALILPEDVSGGTLFFYILEGNKTYEIAKENIKFEAGKSYKVVLDMAAETTVVTTLKSNMVIPPGHEYQMGVYQLSTPAECRAAAYRNGQFEESNYQLTADIDFENEIFLPFYANYLLGNDKKLKNVSIDWEEEDYVGILRSDRVNRIPLESRFIVSNLTLENITIKGNNYVGALGGCNIHATNCQIIGNSSIIGKGDNVGGFVGANRFDTSYENIGRMSVSKSSIAETCTVQGVNQVGGIVGQFMKVNSWNETFNASWTALESCTSAATVTASGDYVGGIFGQMGGYYYGNNYGSGDYVDFSSEDFTISMLKCINKGDVTGKDYVGGIGGNFKLCSSNGVDRVVLKQSFSEGAVSGSSYVGGILGTSAASINTCYSINAISASTSDVGGILGKWNFCGRVANCYSLADLTVGSNGIAGGIVGMAGGGMMGLTVINSYFAGTNTATGCGIIGKSEGSCNVTNCLTTLASLGTNLGNHQVPTGADSDGDGVPEWDYNGDGILDSNDVYYNFADVITNSLVDVTSILANKAVINDDNAYSDDYWDITKYPYYCLKFADFSGDIEAPGFGDSDIEI